MNDYKRIGKNIRGLRLAHGESQEKLGEAIGVSKTAITNYEKGSRELSRTLLVAIADHYMVTIEDLINTDYSKLKKIDVNYSWFWKHIEMIFPIAFSDDANKNSHFKEAHNIQQKCYDLFHTNQENAAFTSLFDCIDGYMEALEDEISEVESAANLIGLYFLMIIGLKSTSLLLHDQPALIKQLIRKDDKIRRFLNNLEPNFEQEAADLVKELQSLEMIEFIDELKRTTKRSSIWADLCDYYLSIQYVYNIVDNDQSWASNQEIGYEMLKTFGTVGNQYALCYMTIIQELI